MRAGSAPRHNALLAGGPGDGVRIFVRDGIGEIRTAADPDGSYRPSMAVVDGLTVWTWRKAAPDARR